MVMPKLLRKSLRKFEANSLTDQIVREYRPLLGTWLIEMALMLNWHCPERHERWPQIFEDGDFLSLTGLSHLDDEKTRPRKRQTSETCREILIKRLEMLHEEELHSDLPLFRNIELLSELLGFNQADKVLLAFAAVLNLFPTFRNVISRRNEQTTNQSLCRLLSRFTDIPEAEFRKSIGEEGLLVTTGLVRIDQSVKDLENKLDLIRGLDGILLSPHGNAEALMGRFLKRTTQPMLTLENFPHLACDTSILRHYIKKAMEEKAAGTNILLYGPPGVGKTQYVQALAAELSVNLYEISFADRDGDPIKGEGRLRAYNLCQRLLCRKQDALLVFDEIEDVFPSGFGLFSFLIGEGEEDAGGSVAGKAWINRTLERNPVPAIWISNRIGHIDPAYRRRFDYSVKFPIPPKGVRMTIAEHHLGAFEPSREWLERIAANEEITPGQLERAAKVARIASGGDNLKAIQLAEQALERSTSLLGQKQLTGKGIAKMPYNLSHLNTDVSIPMIIDGLKRNPRGTFCFYGVPGTGKSELARYIAAEIGKPVIIRRASDILDKYVGASEKNIAAMFAEARQQDAVLVLDEADSYLADRRDATRSWEVSQVNELLTQMEAFEGVFVCTTNLMDRLDPASMRRFAFKVKFLPLTPDQCWTMFKEQLGRLGGDADAASEWELQVRRLDRLTPGDFAVAVRQFELWGTTVTPGELYELLRKECAAKGGAVQGIGFVN